MDAFEGQMFSEINRDVHGFEGDLPTEWEAFGRLTGVMQDLGPTDIQG